LYFLFLCMHSEHMKQPRTDELVPLVPVLPKQKQKQGSYEAKPGSRKDMVTSEKKKKKNSGGWEVMCRIRIAMCEGEVRTRNKKNKTMQG
jgi:hypothetical protein